MKSKIEIIAVRDTQVGLHRFNHPLEVWTFPGGEVGVKLGLTQNHTNHFMVKAQLRCAEGIIALLQIKDALDRMEPFVPCDLNLGYIPYARQDRVCNPGESFGLKIFVDMINRAGFRKIYVDDPHSDVSAWALARASISTQAELFADFRNTSGISWLKNLNGGNSILIAPDAGAIKKIALIAEITGHSSDCIKIGHKMRDSKGKIVATTLLGDAFVEGEDCLIVDDICDGGATFIALAEVLLFEGAKSVNLYVTHGIFSKGKEVFEGKIKNIAAYHDWTV